MKILCAAPTYFKKEYFIQDWFDAASRYGASEVFQVDNSPTDEFYLRWKDQVDLRRIEVTGAEYFERLTLTAAWIRDYALAHHFSHWLNIDSDQVGLPGLCAHLLGLMGKEADVLNHASTNRMLDGWVTGGFGTVLFNRRALEVLDFRLCPAEKPHDVWAYRYLAENHPEIVVKKTYGTYILTHQDGEGTETFYHELKTQIPRAT